MTSPAHFIHARLDDMACSATNALDAIISDTAEPGALQRIKESVRVAMLQKPTAADIRDIADATT